jgi:hypothetical protein
MPNPIWRYSNGNSPNWRYSDIKPVYILRFKEGNEGAWFGLLKLADLGRARWHKQSTRLRKSKEIEFFRTVYYEPQDRQKGSLESEGKFPGCLKFGLVVALSLK